MPEPVLPPSVSTGPGGISLAVVLRFADLAVEALEAAREEIDGLNVFPVADGDTGTNMYLTVVAAREAARTRVHEGAGRDDVLEAFARGALLGARGSSGGLLSEMLGAVVRRIAASTPGERNAVVLADGLAAATEASYAAVGDAVEGTMLSVAAAASRAAAQVVGRADARAADVFAAAAAAARDALARTPDQLAVLREAGVVDAGGRGLSVLLDAAEHVLTGRRPVPVTGRLGTHSIPVPRPPGGGSTSGGAGPSGPAYEVVYLLDAVAGDPDPTLARLRTTLAALGDSLVVAGGAGLWHVHVHVDDVGAAVEAGIAAGRPHRIRVTRFADEVGSDVPDPPVTRPPAARAVVAVAAGPGLRALFEQAGAQVVDGGPGRRPTTDELLDAVLGTGAGQVLVLPNDPETLRVARLAASAAGEQGVRVAVVPTRAQVQGLAALAVHEPGRAFDADVLEMTATARQTRQGAITVATRRAMTMAGPCEEGDVLGVIGGDFAVVGHRALDVATTVLDRLLGGGGELATVVSGSDDATGELGRACAAWLEEHHPVVDVVVYDGGQERYPLLVAVE